MAPHQPIRGGSLMSCRLVPSIVVALLAVGVVAGAQPAPKAPTAVITLEKGGDIALELFPADAPKTVEAFLKLARDGVYDGTTFHRVVPGLVAQGGDPQSKTLPAGDPRLGTGGPGYQLKAEFNKRKHDRRVLA